MSEHTGSLIIHSNREFRTTLRTALASLKLFETVLIASTVNEAFQVLSSERGNFQLLFIDADLAYEEKQTFLQKLRVSKVAQDSAVVAVRTEQPQEKVIETALSAIEGYDDLLYAPFSASDLLSLGERLVRLSKSRRERREELALSSMVGEALSALNQAASALQQGLPVGPGMKRLRTISKGIQNLDEGQFRRYVETVIRQFGAAQPVAPELKPSYVSPAMKRKNRRSLQSRSHPD